MLQEVFLRVLRFSPLLKNQHFQIPIWSGSHRHIHLNLFIRTPKCFVGKQIIVKRSKYFPLSDRNHFIYISTFSLSI